MAPKRFDKKPGSLVRSGGVLWEVVQKGGARAMKPLGAGPNTVVHPRAKAAAKAVAVRAEKAAKAMYDFDRDFAATGAKARAKGAADRAAMESALRASNRALRPPKGKG